MYPGKCLSPENIAHKTDEVLFICVINLSNNQLVASERQIVKLRLSIDLNYY